ncbi:hypothetical protein TraAM80_01521 [Trypanosoma rangeli]|uniref:Elongation of fatty acids protein n=1 Tax=Trypanosoma rangeli TaxID=5698 RepID=A0A422NYG2_TRYRA|nr:uncharacterized protein TraAM80_01521 [Trypanosoma rangeli]RNF10475.1 hypothetical protein TraAM80_01521 [Trypanosoma rangeli]|eukprot:RNF10475.1 hypothetical protein TraAM80_01521 [Trypanosoma rangeli]
MERLMGVMEPVGTTARYIDSISANFGRGRCAVAYGGTHLDCALYLTVMRLWVVVWVLRMLEDRKPASLRHVYCLWNLFLNVFSAFGTCSRLPTYLEPWRERGLC